MTGELTGELLPGANAELAGALRTAVGQAVAAWPMLAVAPERFARYLAARVADEDDPATALRALHVADLYLACACVDGEPSAIAVFDRDYLARLPTLLVRARAERAAIEEVRQRLATRLLVAADGLPPKLDRYGGRGPLATWLRVVATRALSNLRRSRDGRVVAEHGAADSVDAVAAADPELELIRQRVGVDVCEALAAAFASLEPRERNLLRLHFVERLSIDGLAPVFSVSRATAARHLAAARDALAERTVANLRTRLRLTAPELESLIGQVRSKLDVSLSAVLVPA